MSLSATKQRLGTVSPVGGVGFRPVELANPKGWIFYFLDLPKSLERCAYKVCLIRLKTIFLLVRDTIFAG
jgi:hypothetical protein